MNTTIDHLLTNVYELEGLLLVMDRHKGEVPPSVISRFKEKAQEVADVAKSLEFPNKAEAAPASIPEPLPDPAPQATSTPSTPVKIEEPEVNETPPPFSKSATKDITGAFTINDRFLFQRELFDGDKEKFDDTIATLQHIGDIDKMKEHMTDILGWDTSNEVVKEFIRLIDLSIND